MTDRIPVTAQIIEVDREIKMRQHVYPRRVADGKMSQAAADRHIAAMRAVTVSLGELIVAVDLIKELCDVLDDVEPLDSPDRGECEALTERAREFLEASNE